jgi:hypothetical protein
MNTYNYATDHIQQISALILLEIFRNFTRNCRTSNSIKCKKRRIHLQNYNLYQNNEIFIYVVNRSSLFY